MVEPSQPGIQRCLRCRWLFVSPDPQRLRRCRACKAGADEYAPKQGRDLSEDPHNHSRSEA